MKQITYLVKRGAIVVRESGDKKTIVQTYINLRYAAPMEAATVKLIKRVETEITK